MNKLLEGIQSPADLKKIEMDSLPQLASEIREELISTLSQTGGHLGGNLGAVELTIALHYVFDSPKDKIVWDVGHQCYVHKMLTGRREQMNSIRQYQGLAGFAKITESEHDIYGAGHASTSISASYGLTVSRDLSGQDHQVIAVIGDGSMTGGMAYEGLNNLGSSKRNMIIILNDNSMSIAPNVGAINDYLTSLMADQTYNKVKSAIWEITGRSKTGEQLREVMRKVDKSIKSLLVPGVLFEKMGVRYFGPVDGHDVVSMIKVLQQFKTLAGPKLLHIRTVKGKGYRPAEEDYCRLHGVSKFDKVTGKSDSSGGLAYTKVFGEALVDLAREDESIVAVTAAMPTGTGLDKFSQVFPERFFDVGIAEQHAVVFSAGMARDGKKPVAAIYSTFLQRAFDPIIHDLALQKLPVVLAMDRAGLVGNDGPTHHGCFDISYLRMIPNLSLCAPKDGSELRQLLKMSLQDHGGPVAIRFPRAKVPDENLENRPDFAWGSWEVIRQGSGVAIFAIGSMVHSSLKVAEIMSEQGVDCTVVNCRFVKPMDLDTLREVAGTHPFLVTVEEGALIGGFGSGVNDWLCDTRLTKAKLLRLGIPDNFIEHGNRDTLLRLIALHPEGIAQNILDFIGFEGDRSLTIKQTQSKTSSSRIGPVRVAAKEKQ